MKLILQREQLLKPLQLVIGAVDHKQAMPILSNVLLKIDDKKLSVTGTDLEIELIGQSSVMQSDQQAAKFTLPARKLFDICKALPESSAIELYQDSDRVTLTANHSRFVMSTLSADEFPDSESTESNLIFTISQSELSTLLHRTVFAMAQQDVRYYLNGMLFEIRENRFRVVATDGHRLALNQTNIMITQLAAADIFAIVPYRAVTELMRLLKDIDAPLTVHIGHHHIRVFCDEFVFTSKLIEGNYPAYQRVIPKMGDKIVVMDRDTLRQALSRTAILCNDKVRSMRLELEKNKLKLSANNAERDAAEDEIEIQYLGDAVDIRLNVTYLLDVLNIVQPGSIRLTFIDANSSVRIDEPGNENNSIFVVMPMR